MSLHPEQQHSRGDGGASTAPGFGEHDSAGAAHGGGAARSRGVPAVSVVVPAFNAADHIERLLASLKAQTLPPSEVVIVDSSPDEATEAVVERWRERLPIVYRKLPFAYPGYARNTGVSLAGCQWIAFLDCRTIPEPGWLQHSMDVASATGAEIVAGVFTGNPRTPFQKIIHAASYGDLPVRSLPGSLVRKELYLLSGGLIGYVRAGEDLEWFGRLERRGVTIVKPSRPLLEYDGYPETLSAAVRKWYLYSRSAADIEVVTDQKLTYCLVFLGMLVLFAFRWNAYFAHWNEHCEFYIPHITKIVAFGLFSIYGVYRGLVRPSRREVPLSYLLPWRWLQIVLVGFLLDLAKAPGNLLGAVLLFRRRMRAAVVGRLPGET